MLRETSKIGSRVFRSAGVRKRALRTDGRRTSLGTSVPRRCATGVSGDALAPEVLTLQEDKPGTGHRGQVTSAAKRGMKRDSFLVPASRQTRQTRTRRQGAGPSRYFFQNHQKNPTKRLQQRLSAKGAFPSRGHSAASVNVLGCHHGGGATGR